MPDRTCRTPGCNRPCHVTRSGKIGSTTIRINDEMPARPLHTHTECDCDDTPHDTQPEASPLAATARALPPLPPASLTLAEELALLAQLKAALDENTSEASHA